MPVRLTLLVAILVAARPVIADGAQPRPLVPIELVLVDGHAIAYATFQSHNQKVVSNRSGIFITYLHRSNGDYTAQEWRLAHSTDGGQTFATLFEATNATSAPAMETNREGTLYLARPDFLDHDSYLYRFDTRGSRTTSAAPTLASVSRLPGGGAGKYCLLLDEPRRQLYYFAHDGTFHVVGIDGTLRKTLGLLTAGRQAVQQYPHLALGGDGTLHAAWTTSAHGVYLYRSIQAMRSPDGGTTWKTLAGDVLTPPIVADDTGPTARISRTDELDVHSWLSGFMARGDRLHLVYWAKTEPERQRYLRYEPRGERTEKEIDIDPLFAGRSQKQANDSGALVASGGVPGSTLYFVSTIDDRRRLACLASDDNGATWHEHAISDHVFPHRLYSIGAARELTADGYIIGTFTDVVQGTETYYQDGSGRVYFFRIRAGR